MVEDMKVGSLAYGDKSSVRVDKNMCAWINPYVELYAKKQVNSIFRILKKSDGFHVQLIAKIALQRDWVPSASLSVKKFTVNLEKCYNP